ncbi:MAG: CDP-alcohol phosphatidyltransferase family protein [Patescibacteria group bacterium]|jgi:CDP-diacylglycerol--glycerol-3-phosphate 3-phosphatidyltransferase
MNALTRFLQGILKHVDLGLQKIARLIPNTITPNFLTLLRIIMLAPIILAIQQENYILATILFLFAYALDILDGPLARVKNQISEFGKVFDPTADKIVFITVLIILGWETLPHVLIYIIIGLEAFLVLLVVLFAPLAKKIRVEFQLGANVYGKIKMLFQTVGTIVLFITLLIDANTTAVTVIFSIASVFSALSILGHLLAVKRIPKTPSA